jgi:hypothetical protein
MIESFLDSKMRGVLVVMDQMDICLGKGFGRYCQVYAK